MEGETKICPCFQHATEKNGDSDPNEGFLRSLKGRRNSKLKSFGHSAQPHRDTSPSAPRCPNAKSPKDGKRQRRKGPRKTPKMLENPDIFLSGHQDPEFTESLAQPLHCLHQGKFCCLCALKTSFKRVEMGFSQPLGWDFISTTPERGRTAPKNTSKGFRQSVPPLSLAQFLLGPFRARFSPPKR